MQFIYLLILFALSFRICHALGDFEVQTTHGIVKGNFNAHKDNTHYNYFVGIPYAKPPVGDKRFKSPEKPTNWEYRDENSPAHNCVQQESSYSETIGNEDCLYLNIYTPSFPGSEKHALKGSPKYPVMVWFHDGDFYKGSRDENQQRPLYLVHEGVTVVTINYRLGVFGFLSLGNQDIPGNMGLKDQVLALEWIQENIERFGGDKSKITLFGSGAGAASINYLMLCKRCRKDLFHRVILQSGSAFCQWASQFEPKFRAELFGKMFGVTGDEDFKTKLYSPNSRDIYRAAQWTRDYYLDTLRGHTQFLPVIETSESKDPIITQSIEDAMKEYTPNGIQIMVGFNNAEGIKAINQLPFADKWIDYTVSASIPISAKIMHNDPKNREILDVLKKAYIDEYNKDSFIDQYVRLMTDGWYLYGIYRAALEFSKKNTQTYFYKFSYDKYSYYRNFKLDAKYKDMVKNGVSHGDEIAYLFRHNDGYFGNEINPLPDTDEVKKVHQNLVKMWTDFAKTGNPTPGSDRGVKWEPLKNGNLQYLDIGTALQMKNFEEQSRMDTWEQLLKKIMMKN